MIGTGKWQFGVPFGANTYEKIFAYPGGRGGG